METDSCLRSEFLKHPGQIRDDFFNVIPGIWIDGKTYWLESGKDELNLAEGICLYMKEEHVHKDIRMLNVYITNQSFCSLQAKLLFQYWKQTVNEHLSFISPSENVIYHIENEAMHLIDGYCFGSIKRSRSSQPLWNIDHDEIWECSQSGILKYYPMTNGNPVSIQTFDLDIKENRTCLGKSWIISGQNELEMLKLNTELLKNTLAIAGEK